MRILLLILLQTKLLLLKDFMKMQKFLQQKKMKNWVVLSDYPNMKVSVRESSRKNTPNKFKGLTYRYMRKFISVMDSENLDVFERVILHFESIYMENGEVYAAVRDWFLENYPNHKEMIVAAVPTRKAAFTSVPTVEETAAAT